ncbi:hypothetical protein CPB84DRAFT_1854206 [Gymnopilus junonius]|uniref:Uncharacterized protein n=1 Tax=Gymnopilus junonius TaxID=109634 RepID=A0A9P5N8S6_GYMJU|nr:hypothetical protein CPB84DRAFT_1854206 [Gymnopilus junonius]
MTPQKGTGKGGKKGKAAKRKTAVDCAHEDAAAVTPSASQLKLTERMLKNSGISVAPPPCPSGSAKKPAPTSNPTPDPHRGGEGTATAAMTPTMTMAARMTTARATMTRTEKMVVTKKMVTTATMAVVHEHPKHLAIVAHPLAIIAHPLTATAHPLTPQPISLPHSPSPHHHSSPCCHSPSPCLDNIRGRDKTPTPAHECEGRERRPSGPCDIVPPIAEDHHHREQTPPHCSQSEPHTPPSKHIPDEDVKMVSPPARSATAKEHIPAYGSSRSYGGVLRGRASGNHPNIADVPAAIADFHREPGYAAREMGNIHSTFSIKVRDIDSFSTIQEVAQWAGRDYSPVHNKKYHLFVAEDSEWIIKGHYKNIVKEKPMDENFVEWTKNVDKNSSSSLTTFDPSQPMSAGFPPRFGSSIGSCSSHSITPVGLSHLSIGVQEDASPSPSPSEDPSGPLDIVKTLFMQEFSISESVMAQKWWGLHFAWTKYLACKKTLHAAKNLVDSGSWPVSLPCYSEHLIVELFIGKTTWYANYAPLFDKVNENHPEMAEWLELIDASQEDDKHV